jgi:uncharacterized protein (DUF1810 family)
MYSKRPFSSRGAAALRSASTSVAADATPAAMDDPFELHRFIDAQEADYARALAEVRAGKKRSHWMWYIFPQIAGLGSSPMSQRYAIGSLDEARAYLAHPLLGPRLMQFMDALLALEGRSAHDIFGSPDDMKLQSCATLFAEAAPPGNVFDKVLAKYFAGERDARTIGLLAPG